MFKSYELSSISVIQNSLALWGCPRTIQLTQGSLHKKCRKSYLKLSKRLETLNFQMDKKSPTSWSSTKYAVHFALGCSNLCKQQVVNINVLFNRLGENFHGEHRGCQRAVQSNRKT
jgi:hypothetical protein